MKIHGLLHDPEDAGLVAGHTWHIGTRGYVQTHVRRADGRITTAGLHRLILNAQPGEEVDHVNHNPLDNRRANLRIVTTSQNQQNRTGPTAASTTGVRGVTWQKDRQKYKAHIKVDRRKRFLGYFSTVEAAEQAATSARRTYMSHSIEGGAQ